MRKTWKVILAALIAYLLLVGLLLLFESRNPDASIRTFGDALWYTLITMTTVGYGDMTPVTGIGRALGLIFAMASIGILTTVLALGLRSLEGDLLPTLRLFRNRRHTWYVFSDSSAEAAAFAGALAAQDKESVLVFPEKPASPQVPGGRTVVLPRAVERTAFFRPNPEKTCCFCMGPDPWENRVRAEAVAALGFPVCCMADQPSIREPGSLRFFTLSDSFARLYWREHPLLSSENCIVLIGSGQDADDILKRALLTNVFPVRSPIEYHCFGFGDTFSLRHRELVSSLPSAYDPDILRFHEGGFESERELLSRASRIILCAPEDTRNLEICDELNAYYVLGGPIHLRLRTPVPGLVSFGTLEQLLTPENVLREELSQRALQLHRIYSENTPDPPAWQELSPFLKESNISAADHMDTKVRILLGDIPSVPGREAFRLAFERFRETSGEERELLRETEHRRWMRFYRLYNWRWAETRDNPNRKHPSLRPYGELSAEEQAKDDFAWELLGRFS